MASWLDQAKQTLARNIASAGQAFNLPDFRISERVYASPAPTVPYQAPSIPQLNTSVNRPSQGFSQLPTNPTPSGSVTGGGGGSINQVSGDQSGYNNQINNQLDSGNDQIERDYQNYLSLLGGQEQELRSQGPIAEQSIRAGYAPAQTAVKEAEATKLGGLNQQTQTVNTQKQSQLQQARDLYRQIQQQNIAQLSGQGISSSSVAEALAESLGVETARRIAGVSQSADDVIRNIEAEKTNVQTYTKEKLANIEGEMSAKIADIQNQLVQGLNQINTARQIAANDKANRRQDLLSQAQQAVFQIQQNAQNFAQSLQTWQAQTTAKLGEASQNWIQQFSQDPRLVSQIGTLSNQFGQAGLTPSFDFTSGGKVSLGVKPKEEEIANPFR